VWVLQWPEQLAAPSLVNTTIEYGKNLVSHQVFL